MPWFLEQFITKSPIQAIHFLNVHILIRLVNESANIIASIGARALCLPTNNVCSIASSFVTYHDLYDQSPDTRTDMSLARNVSPTPVLEVREDDPI